MPMPVEIDEKFATLETLIQDNEARINALALKLKRLEDGTDADIQDLQDDIDGLKRRYQ